MAILAINWLFVAMPDKPIIITTEIVIDHFQDGMDGRTVWGAVTGSEPYCSWRFQIGHLPNWLN